MRSVAFICIMQLFFIRVIDVAVVNITLKNYKIITVPIGQKFYIALRLRSGILKKNLR